MKFWNIEFGAILKMGRKIWKKETIIIMLSRIMKTQRNSQIRMKEQKNL